MVNKKPYWTDGTECDNDNYIKLYVENMDFSLSNWETISLNCRTFTQRALIVLLLFPSFSQNWD